MFATNEIGGVESNDELIKKYKKLLKTENLLENLKLSKPKDLKSKKLSKSWKLAKLGKKLSKNRNSPNFNTKKNELSFLILNARMAFNCL